jgi:hypothetical protein
VGESSSHDTAGLGTSTWDTVSTKRDEKSGISLPKGADRREKKLSHPPRVCSEERESGGKLNAGRLEPYWYTSAGAPLPSGGALYEPATTYEPPPPPLPLGPLPLEFCTCLSLLLRLWGGSISELGSSESSSPSSSLGAGGLGGPPNPEPPPPLPSSSATKPMVNGSLLTHN